jgi:hypothetical protein
MLPPPRGGKREREGDQDRQRPVLKGDRRSGPMQVKRHEKDKFPVAMRKNSRERSWVMGQGERAHRQIRWLKKPFTRGHI